MNKELWLRRIRNIAGFLGMMLPWLSLLGSVLYSKYVFPLEDSFWRNLSISETYYITPALPIVLGASSIVLMCYDGYNLKDNVVTTISGVFGILIVLFPCNPSLPIFENVGYFCIPVSVSNVIHCVSAVVFFLLLAYNSLFLFTLGDSDTKMKKIRNLIYRVCGVGMIASMAMVFLPHFYAKTFVIEALALTFFGISWLVKGQPFGLLSDKN